MAPSHSVPSEDTQQMNEGITSSWTVVNVRDHRVPSDGWHAGLGMAWFFWQSKAAPLGDWDYMIRKSHFIRHDSTILKTALVEQEARRQFWWLPPDSFPWQYPGSPCNTRPLIILFLSLLLLWCRWGEQKPLEVVWFFPNYLPEEHHCCQKEIGGGCEGAGYETETMGRKMECWWQQEEKIKWKQRKLNQLETRVSSLQP